MPIIHKVDHGWLLIERTGSISTHDENEAQKDRMEDPNVVPGIPVLVDCRMVEPSDSTEVIRYLADQITSNAHHLECGPVAIVVSTDVEFGMARMYQILTEHKHPDTKIFRRIENARKWLRKKTINESGDSPMANSTKGKRRVTFNLGVPGAKKVILAGDFNNWDETYTMNMEPEGKCKKTLMLSPGRYEYKFIVDGKWICDPENPIQCNNVHGTTNSAIVVSPI